RALLRQQALVGERPGIGDEPVEHRRDERVLLAPPRRRRPPARVRDRHLPSPGRRAPERRRGREAPRESELRSWHRPTFNPCPASARRSRTNPLGARGAAGLSKAPQPHVARCRPTLNTRHSSATSTRSPPLNPSSLSLETGLDAFVDDVARSPRHGLAPCALCNRWSRGVVLCGPP